MNVPGGQIFQKLSRLVAAPTIEPSERAARILAVEKDIVLPIKGLMVLILLGSLFLKHAPAPDVAPSTQLLETAHISALNWIELFFAFYVAINAGMAGFYIFRRPGSLRVVQWTVFAMGVLDSALMIALVFLTDGYDSIVYWVFPVLILRNALSIPVAMPQLALNLLLCFCYLIGGIAYRNVKVHDDTDLNIVQNYTKAQVAHHAPHEHAERPPNAPHPAVSVQKALTEATPEQRDAAKTQAISDYESRENRENPLERFIVLLTWAICCYGIQALFEKQKKAEAEATEFAVRQERLHTAGRLAAEIAHQIKNPLGIITNAAFCLQRSIHDGKADVDEQVQIIREEIHRADQIITELMGYAQLAEGMVEKLEPDTELDQAILDVFPKGAKYDVLIRRDYAPNLPALLMQKRHLSGVLVNILQNAREAMDGHGQIDVTIRYDENDSILISIADNGPGIPPDKISRIFEAYFTTRAKGTGLGLAIVKHNTEMYGGKVSVESELGKGTRFLLKFPSRILMKLNK